MLTTHHYKLGRVDKPGPPAPQQYVLFDFSNKLYMKNTPARYVPNYKFSAAGPPGSEETLQPGHVNALARQKLGLFAGGTVSHIMV